MLAENEQRARTSERLLIQQGQRKEKAEAKKNPEAKVKNMMSMQMKIGKKERGKTKEQELRQAEKGKGSGCKNCEAALSLEETVLLESLDPFSKDALRPGGYLNGILEEIRGLSLECFEEDVLDQLQNRQKSKHPWRITVLGRWPILKEKEGEDPVPLLAPECAPLLKEALLGFLVYSFKGLRLSILRLAVPAWARRAGYGSRLMEHVMSKAQDVARDRSECKVHPTQVVCSSFLESVRFYRRLGFQKKKENRPTPKVEDYGKDEDEDEEEEKGLPGQVYMVCVLDEWQRRAKEIRPGTEMASCVAR